MLSFLGTNGRYVYGTVYNSSGTTYVYINDTGVIPQAGYNFSETADGFSHYLGDLGARGTGQISVKATFGHSVLVNYYCTTAFRG